MYAEGNDGDLGDSTQMLSPIFNSSSSQSLVFYYHMYDNSLFVAVGSLEVVVISMSVQPMTSATMFYANETTGTGWTRGCVDLQPEQTYQLIFRATKNSKENIYDADIAIDDVSLQDVTCQGKLYYCKTQNIRPTLILPSREELLFRPVLNLPSYNINYTF